MSCQFLHLSGNDIGRVGQSHLLGIGSKIGIELYGVAQGTDGKGYELSWRISILDD